MTEVHRYCCDGPSCETEVDVDDEHAKYWLVASHVDEEVEEEWHYCSWACLAADAEIKAEEEAKRMQACRNAARQFRLVFGLDKNEERRDGSAEGDGSSEAGGRPGESRDSEGDKNES